MLCIVCELAVIGEGGCCVHHLNALPQTWSVTNRAACDLIHRQMAPAPRPVADAPEAPPKASWQ